MDFLSGLAKSAQPKDDSDQEKSASSDLFADAKLVAEAAQSQFRNEPEKYDKGKVAGAAADLLGAASDYAKLDESQGLGKYVDQAEGYLRQYNTSGQPAPAAAEHKAPASDAPDPTKESGEEKPAVSTGSAEGEKPSGGAGDYIKMAEGFLNKSSGEKTAEGSSEEGYGDLMKMAGGFLKK